MYFLNCKLVFGNKDLAWYHVLGIYIFERKTGTLFDNGHVLLLFKCYLFRGNLSEEQGTSSCEYGFKKKDRTNVSEKEISRNNQRVDYR